MTWYQDPKGKSDTIVLKNLPDGKYKKLTFIVGLPDSRNQHDSLPATLENQIMIWPTTMGGGYHFIKMEGHYATSEMFGGYALHLGSNGFQSVVQIEKGFELNGNSTLRIVFDVNRFFTSPNRYDFVVDPVYSMGDSIAMKKLSENLENAFDILP